MNLLSHKELALLLDHAKAGDTEAFSEIYKATAKVQYYHILNLVSDHQTADDLLQEVYMVLWRKLPEIKNSKALVAYLNSITLHTCQYHERLRKRHSHLPLEEELLANDGKLCPGPAEEAEIKELHDQLHQGIHLLNKKERAILTMRFFQKQTITDISQNLHLARNTVYRYLDSALMKLKNHLHVLFPASFLMRRPKVQSDTSDSGKTSRIPSVLTACVFTGLVCLAGITGTSLLPLPGLSIKADQGFRNTPLRIEIQSELPIAVKNAAVMGPDGILLPAYKKGSAYMRYLTENGTYKIILYGKNGKKSVRKLEVQNIDTQKPELLSHSLNGNMLTLRLRDKGSGIKEVCAEGPSGQKAAPITASEDIFTFRLSPGNWYIYAEDHAGNVSRGMFHLAQIQ